MTKTENGINVTFMNTSMELEIVERSSGYWIVDDYGVAWDEPFIHISQAIRQLNRIIKDAEVMLNHLNTKILSMNHYFA